MHSAKTTYRRDPWEQTRAWCGSRGGGGWGAEAMIHQFPITSYLLAVLNQIVACKQFRINNFVVEVSY